MTDKNGTLDKYTVQRRREATSHTSNVFLDRMDGYQFQGFIADLYQRLGFSNVRVGPVGADEGIDIKMEQPTAVGTIRCVVECKHHAEGIIGRPVIQKLHSAIITKAMNKGIVVTSGYFSSDAIQYAENVGIELVDIDKLEELGKKVGLTIHAESVLLIDNCFPIPEESEIVDSLNGFLEGNLKGFHEGLMRVEDVSLRLKSAYMIDYAINAEFSTSVGIIHSVNESSSVFFEGENGHLLNQETTNPFLDVKGRLTEIHEKEIKAKLVKKEEFFKSFREVKENAKEALRSLYTKTVSYHGRNNVAYAKTCIPSNRDIVIRDARRVYLPIWSIGFSILKNKYIIVATETSGRLNHLPRVSADVPLPSDFTDYPYNCMVCHSSDVGDEAYVCNECGAITCKRDNFCCKVCGKTICRNDVRTKRKFLFFKDRYCPRCAESRGIV